MTLKDKLEDLAPELDVDSLVEGVYRRRKRQRALRTGAALGTVAVIAVSGALLVPRFAAPPAGPEAAAPAQEAAAPAAEGAAESDEKESEALESGSSDVLVAGKMLLDGKNGSFDPSSWNAETPVRMCQAHMQSSPPQCSGGSPQVIGEIDWEAIEGDSHTSFAWVVGTYDHDTATLTLAEPPSLERPPGAQELQRPDLEYGTERSSDARAAVDAILDSDLRSDVETVGTVAGNAIEVNAFVADEEFMQQLYALTDPHVARDDVHVVSFLQPLES